jgi:hypothetical protein
LDFGELAASGGHEELAAHLSWRERGVDLGGRVDLDMDADSVAED